MDAARDFESLQIKTKSIEQTLLPLVKQVGLFSFSDHHVFLSLARVCAAI
jgi:hypothetical protein